MTKSTTGSITDLAALLVDIVNGLDRIQMVNARIEPDLVQYDDTSFFRSGVQFFHGRGDITRGDDVGFTFEGRFYHGSMIRVWYQRDDEIVGGDLGVKSRSGIDIKANSCSCRQARAERLGAFESPAG